MAFHTNDLLMAHGHSQVIADFVKKLDEAHVKNDLLNVTRGKLSECLGMTIDLRTEGKRMFSQHDSIKKFWMPLLEDLHGPNSTIRALEDLFKADT